MRKKTRKRLPATLIATAMAAFMLTGCSFVQSDSASSGGNTSSAEPEASSAESVAVAKTAAADGTESQGSENNDEKFMVGFSCYRNLEERYQREVDMFKAGFEAAGYDFTYQFANMDTNKEITQVENMISSGADLLIINGGDSDADVRMVEICKEAGVPCIAYDNVINTTDVDYLLTFDPVKTGEMMAKGVFENAPKGNYIVLYGDQANALAQKIKIGNWNIIQEAVDNGDINVVMEQFVEGWDPNKAQEFVENALAANDNNIAGVIAPNDGEAGGVVQALLEQGLAGSVPVGGQDADLAACKRIVDGTQTMTVYKNIINLNQAAVELSIALLEGKDPKTEVSTELGEWGEYEMPDGGTVTLFSPEQIMVTKDNMMDTVIALGYQTKEDVYADIPKDQWPE